MENQVEELKQYCPNIGITQESKITYYLLSALRLPDGCKPGVVDALLCTGERDGYPSRLFFAEKIQSSKSQNWNGNNVRILDRNWFAYSWKLNVANQRLAEILANHLRAL